MPKLKGLLDTARTKLTGLLGDFPQGFNAGAVAGFPGWAGDMAYMADTARLALTGADQQAAPENYVGTTDYIAKQAGYPVPQTLSGQLGAAVGGLMSPGPGDLAKFAPLGAMFLGAKAKTAMPDVLEYAQAMEKAGKSADEIWQTTGKLGQPWFKGADGKWRFEIPDNKAMFRGTWPTDQKLAADAVHHPELMDAYPDMGGVIVKDAGGDGGVYRPGNQLWDETIEVGTGSGEGSSIMLHELQHATQQREGFARGGNLDNAPVINEAALAAVRKQKAEALGGLDPYRVMNTLSSGYKVPEADIAKFEEWKRLTAQEDEILAGMLSPREAYKRLAGEAEARNVQSRMNLTMDERLALPPWATQDVPTEQQIVRSGDGASMAIEDFAARRAGKAKPYREAINGM